MKTTLKTILLTSAFAIAGSAAGYAQDAAAPAAAAPAAPMPPTLSPAMGGLAANASPMSFDLSGTPVIGELLGKTYVTGVASGYAQFEDHAVAGDHKSIGDLSNGQVFIQKVDGMFQYFIQVGAYSLPYIGAAYTKAGTNTSLTYGPFAQGYVKIAPLDNFSIQAGKLPTLIGDEYTFSFENMNIQRGLLWAQEPAVSDGVQLNYTMGPVALAASINDGLYSDRWSWLSASAIWTINPANTLALVGGGNMSKTYKNTFATPALQNNEQIYNLIYTYTSGPVTISPYLQYTHVPSLTPPGVPGVGVTSGKTWAGAILAKYAFDSNFSVAARAEYEDSSGAVSAILPGSITGYGPGADAWSLTVTPTYQYNIFFLRAEASYVHISSGTVGFEFGPLGNKSSQFRFAAETGIVF